MLTELRNKLQIKHYLHYNKSIDETSIDTPINTFYKRLYSNRYNIYDIIPKNKIREEIDHLDAISHAIPDVSEIMIQSYNDNVVSTFRKIEESGFWTEKGPEYTRYNLFTSTGRPSNSNKGTNYAALNKEDGTRSKYISRHQGGILAEFDYDAYHLRLIAELIGVKQPEGSFHRYLGALYFDTDSLTDEQYNDSKKLSFQILYGGIPKEFLHIDYFKKTNEYIFKLWDIYNSKGYIETPILKRRFYKRNFKDMNPQKLFNYFIQAFETEKNSESLKNILAMLENKFSKMVLYVYDAFVFDISSDDGKEILKEIKKLMVYPTKLKIGRDYHNMRSLDL
tara:strand:+ start:6954 stop:7964 length:1011 start_codon:yes stop_codon:yes gene_type:complete